MQKFLFTVTLFLSALVLATAQNNDFQYRGDEYYSHDEDLTLYLMADYESRRGDEENYNYRLLQVLSNTDRGLSEIQSLMLADTCGAGVSYQFDDDFTTFFRKMVLIRGKFCFYVYNLRQRELLGPFQPHFWGMPTNEDAGMILSLQISEDGKSIFGSTLHNGSFYYDFSNFEQTEEILPQNMPFFSTNRFYLLPSEGKEDYFDGLFIYEDRGDIMTLKVFSERKLAEPDRHFLVNISEELKERLIMTATLEENKYTIFEELTNDGSSQFLVIDVFMGNIYELPEYKQFDSREEVYQYLAQ